MPTQAEKCTAFRALHQREGAFVIPNPWDVGSAKLLEQLGFEALATSSAGFAFSIGKQDGSVDRDTMLEHAAAIVSATALPVSADLESGYAAGPEGVAQTVRLAAAAGLAGCSIEDLDEHRALYDLPVAAERVRAAAAAARSLPFPFTITARAENFLVGRPDLHDAIARLQAYQEAGADVLYAPGLAAEADIRELVRSVDRPVNVLAGMRGINLTLERFSELGVRRLSLGSALANAAYGAFLRGAREILARGTFTFVDDAEPYANLNAAFAPPR